MWPSSNHARFWRRNWKLRARDVHGELFLLSTGCFQLCFQVNTDNWHDFTQLQNYSNFNSGVLHATLKNYSDQNIQVRNNYLYRFSNYKWSLTVNTCYLDFSKLLINVIVLTSRSTYWLVSNSSIAMCAAPLCACAPPRVVRKSLDHVHHLNRCAAHHPRWCAQKF